MTHCVNSVFRVADRSPQLASVRYRALMPILALHSARRRALCISGKQLVPSWASVVHAVKPLVQREMQWVYRAARAGTPTVVDLCDNVFAPNYGNCGNRFALQFRELARRVSAVTAPTRELADLVRVQSDLPPDRVFVVPDIAETPDLVRAQHRLAEAPRSPVARVREYLQRKFASSPTPVPPKQEGGRYRLLWFGNHGAAYARYGIEDLLLFGEPLREVHANCPIELWVVSNNPRKFINVSRELRVPSRYFEWTAGLVDQLLPVVDLVLVPNSLDEFSRTKSPNRALKALAAGVPVVATRTPAYEDLLDCVWTDGVAAGIETLLAGGAARERCMEAASRVLASRYSIGALRDSLCCVHQALQGNVIRMEETA